MRMISRLSAYAAAAALSISLAFAAPDKTAMKKAAPPTCPLCKEVLPTKKDTMHPKAVKINGKTYYACPRGADALKKRAAAKKTSCPVKPGTECANCPIHSKEHKTK